MKKLSVFILSFLLLFACSMSLPQNKLSYVGEWSSKEMYLLILAYGPVAYKRLQNGDSTSINVSLKEFVADNFVVGPGFVKTTFEVAQAPNQMRVVGLWQWMALSCTQHVRKLKYKSCSLV